MHGLCDLVTCVNDPCTLAALGRVLAFCSGKLQVISVQNTSTKPVHHLSSTRAFNTLRAGQVILIKYVICWSPEARLFFWNNYPTCMAFKWFDQLINWADNTIQGLKEDVYGAGPLLQSQFHPDVIASFRAESSSMAKAFTVWTSSVSIFCWLAFKPAPYLGA